MTDDRSLDVTSSVENIEDLFMKGVYNDSGYIDWQKKRIKFILNTMGVDFFKGKKVLELACFEGGISQMLHNLGADLTSVEGLQRNYDVCKQRYPHLRFELKDLDVDQWDFDDHYDIIIHWGLLYHLKRPDASLGTCLKHCDYLLLETLVVDRDMSHIAEVTEENKWGTDQSIHQVGTRFTVPYVENLFKHLKYVRYDRSELNSLCQPQYDWVQGNTGGLFRRFWIINCNEKSL